jgi:hypothetical protein
VTKGKQYETLDIAGGVAVYQLSLMRTMQQQNQREKAREGIPKKSNDSRLFRSVHNSQQRTDAIR